MLEIDPSKVVTLDAFMTLYKQVSRKHASKKSSFLAQFQSSPYPAISGQACFFQGELLFLGEDDSNKENKKSKESKEKEILDLFHEALNKGVFEAGQSLVRMYTKKQDSRMRFKVIEQQYCLFGSRGEHNLTPFYQYLGEFKEPKNKFKLYKSQIDVECKNGRRHNVTKLVNECIETFASKEKVNPESFEGIQAKERATKLKKLIRNLMPKQIHTLFGNQFYHGLESDVLLEFLLIELEIDPSIFGRVHYLAVPMLPQSKQYCTQMAIEGGYEDVMTDAWIRTTIQFFQSPPDESPSQNIYDLESVPNEVATLLSQG